MSQPVTPPTTPIKLLRSWAIHEGESHEEYKARCLRLNAERTARLTKAPRKRALAPATPPMPIKIRCWACEENQPNQAAHFGYCLPFPGEEDSFDDFADESWGQHLPLDEVLAPIREPESCTFCANGLCLAHNPYEALTKLNGESPPAFDGLN